MSVFTVKLAGHSNFVHCTIKLCGGFPKLPSSRRPPFLATNWFFGAGVARFGLSETAEGCPRQQS